MPTNQPLKRGPKPSGRTPLTKGVRTGRSRNGHDPIKFPPELIKPHLERFINEYRSELTGVGGITVLEQRSGIGARRIYDILRCRTGWVTLGLVDDLFTKGLHCPHLFWTDPKIAEIYFADLPPLSSEKCYAPSGNPTSSIPASTTRKES